MSHIVEIPAKPFQSYCKNLVIHQVPAAQDNLIWLIEYEKGYVAAVDGPSAKEVLTYCSEHQLQLTTIINTHIHGDHIGINHDLHKIGLLKDMRVIGAAFTANQIPGLTEPVKEGSVLTLGNVNGIAIETNGHINGHICYLFSDVLFSGDTLFTGGCGYLFDGPPKAMFDSLSKLRTLPLHTKVCCAHEYTQDNLLFAKSVEPNNTKLQERYESCLNVRLNGGTVVPSTLEQELQTNPFLRWDSQELISSLQKTYPEIQGTNPADIFAYTRALKDSKRYRN